MNWFIDADALSQASKPRPNRRVMDWISQHGEESYLSALTLAEAAYGFSVAPEHRRAGLEDWLTDARALYADRVLAIDEAVLVEWKRLLRHLQASGTTLACEDTLLAAHARHLGFGILTMNKRHFADTGIDLAEP